MEVNKPWVTEALKLEIQKKYQLYNIAKEKKNDSDWQIYKDQRILVGKITNTAKIEYIGSHPEAVSISSFLTLKSKHYFNKIGTGSYSCTQFINFLFNPIQIILLLNQMVRAHAISNNYSIYH